MRVCNARGKLQWSRGSKTAERAYVGCLLGNRGMLQWGRGFKTAESVRMPSPVIRHRLQWGRGFKTAERTPESRAANQLRKLQWGRGFKTAERSAVASGVAAASGFNGAAVLKPRRALAFGVVAQLLDASMGPRF